jgi:PsbP-like protein
MNKKVFLGLLVIVMTLAVATTGCTFNTSTSSGSASPSASAVPQTIAGYSTYTNATAGLRMQYPSGWNLTEGGTSTRVVKFSGPEGTNVILVKGRDSRSLDVVKDVFISSILNETSYNYTLVSTEKTTLAGMPAYNVTLTSSYLGVDLKQMQTIVKKDDQVYMISYTTALEQWPNYLDEINNMGNSLAFTS